MAGANMETRTEVLQSASDITKSAGGNLAIGPFDRDVIVNRFGALITTTTASNAVAVTTSPNIGSMTIPVGAVATHNYVKRAVASPSAPAGTQPGQYVLPKGSTLTVTGAVAAGAGAYRFYVEIIKKPLHVDGVTVHAA